jgi:hypothetical protein
MTFLVPPLHSTQTIQTPNPPECCAVAKNKQVEVQMDRRSKADRRGGDRRKQNIAVVAERRQGERRVKVPRRRQIDPTTCERDYSNDEIEFMQALDAYKRANGRMFPTCSEVLEVIRNLGYVRVSGGTAIEPAAPAAESVVEGLESDSDEGDSDEDFE